MPEGVVCDPTDTGTLRPNAKPLQRKGSHFIPMKCPDFGFEINLPHHSSPDDPITLFTLYYTPEIIQSIVQHTNNYIRKPQDPTKPRARALAWYPTCVSEMYTYFAIRVYMSYVPLAEISDYWAYTKGKHEVAELMTKDRFIELRMRYRVGLQDTDIFARVVFGFLFQNPIIIKRFYTNN